MRTFEQWIIEQGASHSDYEVAAAAWQACAAEYQPRLDELVALVEEWLCSECNTVYPGPPQKGVWCVICPKCEGMCAPRLVVEKKRLQAIIDEARKALAAWEHWYSVDSTEFNRDNARDQGLDVLDRSGARGGASRNEPERLVDNSSFTEDRSRTEWLRLQGRKI